MALELVYTSAERGLRPGTSGFCTVAMTRGLPPALVPRLEALGGYRPGPSGDGPVAFCFWRVETAGGIAHVLSVVGPAPPDHTARTNKIATYAVLGPGELSPAGPAWMIARDGFLRRSWKGAPAWIEAPLRAPAADDPGPAECTAWKAACGDAGWAGAVASAFLRDQSKPIHVVYGAGTDPLPLVEEVIRLLPDWARWRATFSTYFLQPVAGTPCALRFCLDGTAAADAARQSKGLVLDLVRPMGEAPESRHVRMARTGVDAEAATAVRTPGTPKAAAPRARAIELAPDTAPAAPAPKAPRAAAPLPVPQAVTVAEDEGPKPWIYAAVAGGVTLLALLVVLLVIAVQSCGTTTAGPAPAPEAGPASGTSDGGQPGPTPAFTVEPMSTPKPSANDDGSAPPAASPEQSPEPIRLPTVRGGQGATPVEPAPADAPAEQPDAAPTTDAPAEPAGGAPEAATAVPSAPAELAPAVAAPIAAPSAPRGAWLQFEDGSGAVAVRSRRQSVSPGAVGVRFAPAPSLERSGACTVGGSWVQFGSGDLRATARLDAGNLVIEGIAKGTVPDALAAALGGAAAPAPRQALLDALARCMVECTDRSGAVVERVQVRPWVRKDLDASGEPRATVDAVGPGAVTVVVRAPKGASTARLVAERESVEIDAAPGVKVHASRSTMANGLVLHAAADRSAGKRTAELMQEIEALRSLRVACDSLQRLAQGGQRPADTADLLRTVQGALDAGERAALKLPPEASDADPTVSPEAILPHLAAVRNRTSQRIDRLTAELGSPLEASRGKLPPGWRVQAFDADGIMLFDGAIRSAKEARP